jgi:hypothetical protein
LLVLVLLIAPILCHAQLERNEVAALAVADFTQPSAGKFVSGWNAGTHITQASRAGIGGSFEYRFWLGNGFAAGLLYTGTPTNSKLTMPDHSVVSWPISRNEIDLLLTRELKTVARRRISPYVTAGGGAIVLNGGKTESGLDRQAAFIVGGGGDIKHPRTAMLPIEARGPR